MNPGIYHNLPFDEYAAIPAISNTALGKMNPPARYKEWLESPEEDGSDSLRIGRIAHRAALEPELWRAEFENFYAVKPDGMRFTTREGKEWRNAQHDIGRAIITHDESEFLAAATERIRQHKTASQMLRLGRAEVSVVGEYNGIPVKCRVDFMTDDTSKCLVDFKTARDASKRGFQRAMMDRAYYRQGAFYLDCCKSAGLDYEHFAFLAIEKDPPYLIGCYRLDAEAIEIGRMEYRELLGVYIQCLRNKSWPGYSEELETLSIPFWKQQQAA